MTYARITGVGHFAPEKVVANEDLESIFDTSHDWIVQRTGIERRHVAEPGTGVSDLAHRASVDALEQAGVNAGELDLIVFATVTPDQVMPSSAAFLQAKLGASNAFGFDVAAACSGFVAALSIAEKHVKSELTKKVLVVGADIMSNRLDPDNRATSVLFGDGAGAVVVEASNEEGGILSSHLHMDGTKADMLYMRAGGSVRPIDHDVLAEGDHYILMQGQELFKDAVKYFSEVSSEALKANGYKMDDLSLLIPHQANSRIIEAVQRRLKLPPEKVFVNIGEYANTIAATIPIALSECVKAGRIKEGDLVVFAAFGAGNTWGANLVRW